MATVYLVSSGDYSDYRIEAIYSAFDLAVEHIGGDAWTRIERWEVRDSVDPDTRGKAVEPSGLHTVRISMSSGEITLNTSGEFLAKAATYKAGSCVVAEETNYGETEIHVGSPVSPAHAAKVAVEKRQEWLRTRDLAAHASGA